MIKVWFYSCLALGLLMVNRANATLQGLDTTAGKAGFTERNLWVLIPRIFKWLFGFLGIIFLVLMIAGGIIWMTAQGNQEQVKKAKNLLIAAVIGLVVVSAAYAITAFLGDSFGLF